MSLEAIRKEAQNKHSLAELQYLHLLEQMEEERIQRAMHAPPWHLA